MMNDLYARPEPSRSEIDAMPGNLLIEFGTPWCGHCIAAQPLLASVLAGYPDLRHIRIEDGPGRALGRSFRVKLWPTLVLMAHGQEVARLVRPASSQDIRAAIGRLICPG